MAATLIRANLAGPEFERYLEWHRGVCAIAQQANGYRSHETFIAKNGDHVTIFHFETDEAAQSWLRSEPVAAGLPLDIKRQPGGRS
jgi:antibiotic biosynthesis monooxygenase (ABM) superfamily enzyme